MNDLIGSLFLGFVTRDVVHLTVEVECQDVTLTGIHIDVRQREMCCDL